MVEADNVDCKTTSQRLSAYLDGELPQAGAAAVEEHLRGCPQCAAELAALRALSHALDGLEGTAVPARFAARVRRAAEAKTARRRPIVLFGGSSTLSRVLMRVAAGLVAVAGIWVGLNVGGSAFAGGERTSSGTVDVAAQDEFDLQVESLSAAPPGSIAEAYLAFVNYEIPEGQEQ